MVTMWLATIAQNISCRYDSILDEGLVIPVFFISVETQFAERPLQTYLHWRTSVAKGAGEGGL